MSNTREQLLERLDDLHGELKSIANNIGCNSPTIGGLEAALERALYTQLDMMKILAELVAR